MPEMIALCGQRFRVYRRAEKTCVEGHGLRAMHNTVLLQDVYCDGGAHDGCQRKCRIFWKEGWLKPVDGHSAAPGVGKAISKPDADLERRLKVRQEGCYVCQSTELPSATSNLSSLNLGQYLREFRVGELSIGGFARIAVRAALDRARHLVGLPPLGALRGNRTGHSKGDLGLKAGEWVQVKLPEEIRTTLNPNGRNRGLSFEPDMIAYTGQSFEVAYPVEKIISEQTGRMVLLTNTVALKGVVCEGLCAKNCPRNAPHYWREAWLKRKRASHPTVCPAQACFA